MKRTSFFLTDISIISSVTTPRKLLFDECIGKPLVDKLREMLKDTISEELVIGHLLEYYEQGIWDEEWVPLAAQDGWVIVTADRGRKRGGKGDQLRLVCERHQITHIALSRRVNTRKSIDKIMTILSVWHEVLSAMDSPPGSHWSLEPARLPKSQQDQGFDQTKGQLVLKKPRHSQS